MGCRMPGAYHCLHGERACFYQTGALLTLSPEGPKRETIEGGFLQAVSNYLPEAAAPSCPLIKKFTHTLFMFLSRVGELTTFGMLASG